MTALVPEVVRGGPPAIPDPTRASVEALQQACLDVRVWADDCHDVAEAYEQLARVSAIEEYLSKRGQEGPAQAAARWLEVRIGELLGPAENHGPSTVSRDERLTRQERHAFRRLAAHRELVAEEVPASRRHILKVIKQREAGTKSAAPESPVGEGPALATYPCIVIDPPWRYENVATRGAAEDHYPTMSLRELEELEPPVADDAHVYLWVTNSFLSQGFDLLVSWGFTYKTVLTWCKPSIGMGNYFRNNTEHVLFAVKGRLPTQRNDVGTWFQAAKTRHSAKPESFYDLVESCSPGPYLEMFARRRRFGWHVWGNEA